MLAVDACDGWEGGSTSGMLILLVLAVALLVVETGHSSVTRFKSGRRNDF